MSTATYDTEFHVVPDTPTTKARLAEVLWMRLAAQRAFDKARSISRSALGWVVSQLHRWVEATGGLGVLSWVSDHARDAVGLVRTAGVVPSLMAVLSAPPVTAAAVRAATFIGRSIVSVAKAAWTGIKSLLGQCGTTGIQITETLTATGTQVAETVSAVAKHPGMAPVIHALRATFGLVGPVSRGLVAGRLLAALVPVLWLRAVIAFLFMPLLVDSTVLGTVWDWATAQPAAPSSDDAAGTVDGDLLINTFAIPMPGSAVPSDVEQAEVADQSGVTVQADEDEAETDQHLNRASRRAQLREDAHAWRMQHG